MAILVLVILILAWWLGAFKRVELSLGDQPEIVMAGKWFHAPYREILDYAELHFPDLVDDASQVSGICGLYFDNPKLVVSDSLVAFVGVMLSDTNAIPANLSIRHIEEKPALHGTFAGSPIIGQFKIYPAAERWLEASKLSFSGPVLEIYHRQETGEWVDYYFPLERHED